MTETTYWNGEPCSARKVTVVVADSGKFPSYWAKELVGTRRDAVEVTYYSRTFYLDDAEYTQDGDSADYARAHGIEPVVAKAGRGWMKVTAGHGHPRYGHSELEIEPDSVEPRAA